LIPAFHGFFRRWSIIAHTGFLRDLNHIKIIGTPRVQHLPSVMKTARLKLLSPEQPFSIMPTEVLKEV